MEINGSFRNLYRCVREHSRCLLPSLLMDLRQTWIKMAKCLGQRLIRTVMDIDQAKVIIFAIRLDALQKDGHSIGTSGARLTAVSSQTIARLPSPLGYVRLVFVQSLKALREHACCR